MISEYSTENSKDRSGRCGGLSLRRTVPSDLDYVLIMENDKENSPYIRQWSREQHLSALTDPNIAHLILEHSADKSRAGYAILIGCDDIDRSLQLKRIVIEKKGFGYGRQAIRMIKAYGFDQLHCHRLWLEVIEK